MRSHTFAFPIGVLTVSLVNLDTRNLTPVAVLNSLKSGSFGRTLSNSTLLALLSKQCCCSCGSFPAKKSKDLHTKRTRSKSDRDK